ncbi:hypothetical protein Tco_1154520 [Tanacetum coccineum]
MSDSEHSTVTYTSVSIPVEDDSDIGSPGINGPPMMPEDPYAYIMAAYQVPPSPDYIPGPEVPPSPDYIPGPEEPQSPPPLDFVPEPMYPEYMPQEDEILPAEEQPLPATLPPHADPPGICPDSDLERYREDEDEDEEEEVHPAPADSVPPIQCMTARISIRDEPSISLPPREEVERLLALTTPPPSPLTPLSSPLPHIPSPPFPASPPLQLLSSDHRTDRPEITLPPQKRLGIDLGPRYKIGESLAVAATRPVRGRRADYGFVGTIDTEIRRQRAEEGTEGVVGLTQWFEKMESVYSISNYTVACQVKFAMCTLQGNALTCRILIPILRPQLPKTVHTMPWRTLKKMMTYKYCPRGEIKKLEFEMWNLKVKGNDVVTYSQHFQRTYKALKNIHRRGFQRLPSQMTKTNPEKVSSLNWGDKQEAAFSTVEHKLCSAPILPYRREAKIIIAYAMLQRRVWRCVDANRKGDFLCFTPFKIHEKESIRLMIKNLVQ